MDARGPVDAARMTLRRLGWTWPSPFVFSDAEGHRLEVGRHPPVFFERCLKDTVRRQLEMQLASKLQWEDGASPPGRVSVAALRRALASQDLSPLEKGSLRAIATDAVWTRQRLALAGYDVPQACPLSHSGGPDTM